MKQIYFPLVFLAFSSFALAQNVGIGTTSPNEKLEVSGNALVNAYKTKTANTDYHHFIRNGNGSAVYINQVDAAQPILRLSSGIATANQNVRLTVEGDGDVGIGTGIASPSQKLEVAGWIELGNETEGTTGTAGAIRYNTSGIIQYHDGVTWRDIISSSNPQAGDNLGNHTATTDLNLNGNILKNGGSGTNTDHIWYDDAAFGGAPGNWHFVADANAKDPGNARITAGHIYMTSGSQDNYIAGELGVGVASPSQRLEVAGWVELGNETEGTTGTAGAIRYHSSGKIQFHDGTTWQDLYSTANGGDNLGNHIATMGIKRNNHNTGHLEGSYNNVGANSTFTNPIYTIGSNYNPSTTTLDNMYGIGYSHSNFWGTADARPSGWGQYVASDGDIRIIFEASNGRIWASGDVRAPRYYDQNNTAYYTDPASTSIVNVVQHTGVLQSKGATYTSTWMQFDEDQYGNSLILGGGGLTTLGSGESATQVKNNVAAGTETLYLTSDNGVEFVTNLQGGWPGVSAVTIANNGNVGIGDGSPDAELDIESGSMMLNGADFNGIYWGEIYKDDLAHSGAWGYIRQTVANGQIEIGSDDKIMLYETDGRTLRADWSMNSGIFQFYGKVRSDGINETSDARFKKNIQPLGNALSNLMQLQGVSYNWRTEEFPDRTFTDETQLGVIAQEVEKIFPEVVNTGEDGYKSVQYSHLVPVLIEAIKEQQAIIDAQHSTICAQGKRIEDLESQSADMETMKSQLDYLMNTVQQYEAAK